MLGAWSSATEHHERACAAAGENREAILGLGVVSVIEEPNAQDNEDSTAIGCAAAGSQGPSLQRNRGTSMLRLELAADGRLPGRTRQDDRG